VEDKYTDEVIKVAALKIAKEFIDETTDMRAHMLLELVKALEEGEDVYDDLVSMILTRPFVEKLINELLNHKE
jgi:hypothetical protein